MATPFRAIIVGSGLVGLTAAHVFSKAGIDFIILEKHDDPLSTYGSTLAFWPQTIRIFDQLGLLDAAQPILDHCNEIFVLSSKDAQIQNKDRTMEYVKKKLVQKFRNSSQYSMLINLAMDMEYESCTAPT